LFKLFKNKSQYAVQLKQVLGFFPSKISIYQQAFKHKSVLINSDTKPFESNERLEFLGDAILDAIISNYLFTKFPFKDEGYLTQLRSRLVSRKTLNNLGIKIGLKELLESNVEAASKSMYGDALESLIGAIYLDKGYKKAQEFVIQKLIGNHIDIDKVMSSETDFKSRVIEFCQKQKKEIEFIITEKEAGNSKIYNANLKINEVSKGKGSAFSKKQAEQLAAEPFFREIEENY
jgi:ribonuclease III